MKTHPTILVAAIAMACAACGQNASSAREATAPNATPAAASAESAPASKIEACSVLTIEEITSAVGRADFSQGKSRDEGTECRYASGRGSLTVWVSPATKASFDDFRNLLAGEGKKPETMTGVGDDAYFWDDRLYARVGARGLTVDLNQNELKPEPSAERRTKVLALAKTAASKLH